MFRVLQQFKDQLKAFFFKNFRLKDFPKSARWLLIYNFITTFGSLFAPFLIPYLTGWGYLTIEQIFTLQSIFLFVSLIAEVPTGVVADKYSPKLSVIIGDIFFMLGILLYALKPNFYIFILGETLMGIGSAFISGAYDALEYEALKSLKKTKLYDEFISVRRQISLFAFILTSLFGMFIIYLGGLRYIALISAVFVAFGLIPLVFKVQEVNVKKSANGNNESFSPNYLQVMKSALNNIKTSKALQILVVLSILFDLLNSWLWWLSQSLWKFVGILTVFFGIAPIFRKFAGILFNRYWPNLVKRYTRRGLFYRLIVATMLLLVSSWLSLNIPVYGPYLNLLLLSIAAALVVEFVTIIQKPKQDLINSQNRSTLLSFESLISSLVFIIFNPLVGKLAQHFPVEALYSIAALFLIIITVLLETTKSISG